MTNTEGNLNLQQERTRSILHHHYVTYIPTYYNYESVHSQVTAHVSTDTQPELMVSGVGHPPCNILPISLVLVWEKKKPVKKLVVS